MLVLLHLVLSLVFLKILCFFIYFYFLFLLLWLSEFHCAVYRCIDPLPTPSSLLLNFCNVLFSTFTVFFSSVDLIGIFLYFYFFVELFTVFSHSSPVFGECHYDCYFEHFMRQMLKSISLTFFSEALSCSFIWNILFYFLILQILFCFFLCRMKQPPLPVLKWWSHIGD